jgi:hypothetical protein
MPNAVVKSYAEKTGKSAEHVEHWWKDAEKEAAKKFKKGSSRYWAYVNGIVKRRAGLNDALTFKELIDNMQLLQEKAALTELQKQELLTDFQEWSGGFLPHEVPDEVDDYIESSMSADLDQKAATSFLQKAKHPSHGAIAVYDKKGTVYDFLARLRND